jgi:2-methylcitrate dehydratase PrpD
MTITQQFGHYADTFARTSLSDDVVHHAKRAVVDWYASLFPGFETPPVQRLMAVLSEDIGHGSAQLAMGQLASPRTAALIHGAAAHAAEVDDSFRDAMYHPGAATIASALASAQTMKASGLEFLRGIVLGYEVSTRIGVTLGRPHYKFWHSTGTVGSFGAAASAGALYKLDGDAFAHALATAATFAAALQQAFRMDSMSKPLHAGRAAEGGLLAALAARHGMTGSLDVLEGEAGMGKAMSNGPDWSTTTATLGDVFNICRLTFKNHIGCGHTFAPVDGALALQKQMGVEADDIVELHIGTYRPALDIACYDTPVTGNEARFSLRYMVASALNHGSVRLSAYTPERLADPVTRALMARMRVAVDPAIDAAFPGRRAARVVMRTRDGRTGEFFQPDRRGDPELPLSDEDLGDKLRELASPVIGDAKAKMLLDRIWQLESAGDLQGLTIAP